MKKEIVVNSNISNMQSLLDFVEKYLEENNIDSKTASKIFVVVDEVASNIFKYAYKEKEGTLKLVLDKVDNELSLEFIDEGDDFDPLSNNDPDTTLSLSDRPTGGLGLLIVKNIMDSIAHKRENGHNVLTLKKYI